MQCCNSILQTICSRNQSEHREFRVSVEVGLGYRKPDVPLVGAVCEIYL